LREDAQRLHIVDLLLELGREVSRQHANSGAPQSNEAAQNITLLLWALPAECAYTVRQRFNVTVQMKLPGAVGLKMGHLRLNAVGGDATPRQMLQEIAFDIDRYLTSGLPPMSVWDEWDGLTAWMKDRWPQDAPYG
jgi:hypothetical protein